MRKIIFFTLIFALPVAEVSFADLIEEESEKAKPTATPKKDELLDHAEKESPKPSPSTSPSSTSSKKPQAKPKQSSSSPVNFQSKSLRASKKEGTVNLEDNVVVTQDDMRMESDEATVYFEGESNTVRLVKATGNVKFFKIDAETQQKIRAESKEALFYNQDQKVVMKGEPKLWRGDDKMVAKTISYDLKTGWIKADKAEGVVQPSTVKQKGKK